MGKHPKDPRGPDELPYETGYRKPPRRTQFKKGKSGNPAGRPKRAPGLRDTLDQLLGKPLTVNTADGPRLVPTGQLLLQAGIKKALSGNVQAIKAIIELAERQGVGMTPETRELESGDHEVLEQILKDLGFYR
jgi:hypothetical protein